MVLSLVQGSPGFRVHFNARLYDPALGRFTSADSVVPDPSDGQSWNRYAYVRNRPLAATDPSGHWDIVLTAPPRIPQIPVPPGGWGGGSGWNQPSLPQIPSNAVGTPSWWASLAWLRRPINPWTSGSGNLLGGGTGTSNPVTTQPTPAPVTAGYAISSPATTLAYQYVQSFGGYVSESFEALAQIPHDVGVLYNSLQNSPLETIDSVANSFPQTSMAASALGVAVRGLGGAAESGNIVYRGLAAGETAAEGLTARAPGIGNSIASHVAGARASQWISTTRSVEVAMSRFGQNGVVAIDLSKVPGTVVDLTRGIPGLSPNTMLSRWAVNAQEVLIQDEIPASAITPLP